MPIRNLRKVGSEAEELAVKFLEEKGFEIIQRNFQIRGGEIDVIARDKDTLVFIEVKARWSKDFGGPIESLTPQKIFFLKRAINFYLTKTKQHSLPCRLDAVLVDFRAGATPLLTYLSNLA